MVLLNHGWLHLLLLSRRAVHRNKLRSIIRWVLYAGKLSLLVYQIPFCIIQHFPDESGWPFCIIPYYLVEWDFPANEPIQNQLAEIHSDIVFPMNNAMFQNLPIQFVNFINQELVLKIIILNLNCVFWMRQSGKG